jgi:MoxR-like ATPase
MRKGAVLLIDEIDLASNKILCLQPVLEGKGLLNKKTGEYITPADGFTIIATANTKGKGSDDGRFIGTNILNEAFLERFSITMEQEYPTNAIEKKILNKEFGRLEIDAPEGYVVNLVNWADVIRKSFFEGAIDELISTRRLVHIAQAFSMFKEKMKAIELCVSRFDTETKSTFLDLYTKVDAEAIEPDLEASDFDDEELDEETKEFLKDFADPDKTEEAF